MNPGGRFAPQSQLFETAKDGALLRGFGARPFIWVAARGPASLQITALKIPQKNVTDSLTDKILPESPKLGPLSNRPIRQDGLYCSKSWHSRFFSFGAMASIFRTLQNRIISNLHSRDHPSCHLKWTKGGQIA